MKLICEIADGVLGKKLRNVTGIICKKYLYFNREASGLVQELCECYIM